MKLKRRNQMGFSLIEVLIAMALIGTAGIAIIVALGTASKGANTAAERETAKNIAEMQLEYIMGQPYADSYPAKMADYPGYSVVTGQDGRIAAQAITSRTDGNIQKIPITVLHDSKQILTVVGEKTR
jgi:type II secretion system protein I